jgi:type IV pilus assembly protein PilC
MVGSGVPILDAISVTTAATKNTVISDALRDIGRRVEKGFPISLSFAKHPEAFPYIVVQMVAVGEETGKMDEVLDKISRVFEIESDQKVKALTTAIEPLIMIVLGIGVAFLVISIILPIYNLTQSI